jgi:hypothetical protein
MNLETFLKSPQRNVWVVEKSIRVYVRKNRRFFDNNIHECLDIGTVEVNKDKRGTGIFTKFLTKFENEARKQNKYVYVENVLEPRLMMFLARRKYRLGGDIQSMYFKP